MYIWITLSNTLLFLLENVRIFCSAKDSHILSTKNNNVFVIFQTFIETLTNGVVNFEQPGPERVDESHWSVIEHRTRKQGIELENYTAQNLENMADLHGES